MNGWLPVKTLIYNDEFSESDEIHWRSQTNNIYKLQFTSKQWYNNYYYCNEPLLIDFTFSVEWDCVDIAGYYDVSDKFVNIYLLTIKDGGSSDEF